MTKKKIFSYCEVIISSAFIYTYFENIFIAFNFHNTIEFLPGKKLYKSLLPVK